MYIYIYIYIYRSYFGPNSFVVLDLVLVLVLVLAMMRLTFNGLGNPVANTGSSRDIRLSEEPETEPEPSLPSRPWEDVGASGAGSAEPEAEAPTEAVAPTEASAG